MVFNRRRNVCECDRGNRIMPDDIPCVHTVGSDFLETLVLPSQVGLDEISFGRGRAIEFS